jgi:hypothetical protein
VPKAQQLRSYSPSRFEKVDFLVMCIDAKGRPVVQPAAAGREALAESKLEA